jgi:hypothetical protein
MLVTTKKAAGLWPVNSLQIAAGHRPVEKLANLYQVYARLRITNLVDSGYNEKGCRPMAG